MYTLFIDTHDKDILLGLYKDGKAIDKNVKTSERNHSDYVMPMLEDLMKRNKLTVHDLNEILTIIGPGSFTGVRLGVTIAKTLAYTLNIPIKGISSLEMYAASNVSTSNKLVVIRDIKGAFLGLFSKDDKLLEEYKYLSNNDLNDFLNEESENYEVINDSSNIDLDKVYEYSKNIDTTTPHNVNPIYIKVIEVLK